MMRFIDTATGTVGTQRGPESSGGSRASAVPLSDLRAQIAAIREELNASIAQVLDSSAYVLGPRVAEFERAFAQYVRTRHCVAVNSGTSALHLALICAGVQPGDEVITVPMTFIATSWAISYCSATPVYVDIDPVTYTMDAERVERAITSRTKALLPVHLYGQMADMEPLLAIGRRYGIPVIEDAAQAHGASYCDEPAGSMGLCGCFSFYPGKNLGACGEGGAVVTHDDAIANRLRALRDHAQEKRYHHDEIGYNYRMDGIQGAVLEVKLRHLEQWTQARRALAVRYRELLADVPIQLPAEAPGRRHVWHLFVALHPQRDQIRAALQEQGIQTGLHYPVPLHLQRAYRHLEYVEGDFPVAERVARECLTLPLFAEMSASQQAAVTDLLVRILPEVTR